MIDDWRMTWETHDLSQEAWDYLKQEKFFGIIIPEEYGGFGGDWLYNVVVIEELAAGPTSMAAFLIVQYMIIQVLGTYASNDDQRQVLDAIDGLARPYASVPVHDVSFALTSDELDAEIANLTGARPEVENLTLEEIFLAMHR